MSSELNLSVRDVYMHGGAAWGMLTGNRPQIHQRHPNTSTQNKMFLCTESNYTMSGKKEATLFSTTTLAFLGRFL